MIRASIFRVLAYEVYVLPRQSTTMYGTLPETIYQDAEDLEDDAYATKDWLQWPQIGPDGSVAALLAMISDRKVRL